MTLVTWEERVAYLRSRQVLIALGPVQAKHRVAIALKLERECLGVCGVAEAQWSEHRQPKQGALPGGCMDFFLFHQAVYGVEDICGALVQFGCYHHKDMYVYACKVLGIQLWLPFVNKP